MSGDFAADLARRLAELEAADRRRHLEAPTGRDFASNDYLGLGADPAFAEEVLARFELARVAGEPLVGAPASRLLRGHTGVHARLESRLAAFKGTEAALLLASGWQANVALLTALVGRGDRVLSDRLNHASLIDGMRLARGETVVFPHRDLREVERLLAEPWPGRTFLVTESLFSMDGDLAPLERYAELCEAAGAELLVDDAHAVGLWGERGSGLVEHLGLERRVTAVTSTCGKALGVGGAFIAGPRVVIDYLVNASRPFIFSTAVPPLVLHALEVALDRVEREPERRRRVHRLASRLRRRLEAAGLGSAAGEGAGEGPIVPVVVGGAGQALEVAARAREAGFDVRAVRPPTVPPGTSRLRLSVHADHTAEEIDRLAEAVVGAVRVVAGRTARPVVAAR